MMDDDNSDSDRDVYEEHDPCCPIYQREQSNKEDGAWSI